MNRNWARNLLENGPPDEWVNDDKERLFQAFILASSRETKWAITALIWSFPDAPFAIDQRGSSDVAPEVYEDRLMHPETDNTNVYTTARIDFYNASDETLWRIFNLLYSDLPATGTAGPSNSAAGAPGAPDSDDSDDPDDPDDPKDADFQPDDASDSEAEFKRAQVIQKIRGWLEHYKDNPVKQRGAAQIIEEKGENLANPLETYSDDTLKAVRAYLSRTGVITMRDLDAWRDVMRTKGKDHAWSKMDIEYLKTIKEKSSVGKRREAMEILKEAQNVEEDFEVVWERSELDERILPLEMSTRAFESVACRIALLSGFIARHSTIVA